MSEPTTKEMLEFLNKVERILGGVYSSIKPDTPDEATENRGILTAIRALISRADDVQALVEAGKGVRDDYEDHGNVDTATIYALVTALIPFMKEKI